MSHSPRGNQERSPRGRAGNKSFWTTTDRDLDRASWRREPASDAGPPPPPPPHGAHESGRPYSIGCDGGRGRPFAARATGYSERRPYPSGEEEDRKVTEGDSQIRGLRMYRYPKEFGRYGGRGRARGRGREAVRVEMFGAMHGGDANGYHTIATAAGGGRSHPPGGPSPRGMPPDCFETATNISSCAPPADNNRFNASEALRVFQQRWQTVCNELQDTSLSEDERPKMYKADKKSDASSSFWGQSKLPLQPSVSDFLSELQAALARSESSENGDVRQ